MTLSYLMLMYLNLLTLNEQNGFYRFSAILNDQYDLATLLLRHNATVDQPGPLSRTALHECAFLGLENFVHLLLGSGADPNACDTKKKTPLALAAQNGHLNVVEVLLQKGKVPALDFTKYLFYLLLR